jgi:TatD DNase family protein
MLIDSHCHLSFNAFDEDRHAVLARAHEAGVVAFINPGLNLEESRQVVALAAEIPNLYAAVGFHPNEAGRFGPDALAELRQLAAHPKVVAIGEIGLDYYWDKAPRSIQRYAFAEQLALAKSLHKPVIIHQRDAPTETMAILREWANGGEHPGLVLHSFSGDRAMAEEAVALGFYVGVSGPITFKNSRDLPGIVAALPPTRILVETDAPFLSPHPFRGKRNEPARVRLIAERIAAEQGVPLAEMSRLLTQNSLFLFKLPGLALDSLA